MGTYICICGILVPLSASLYLQELYPANRYHANSVRSGSGIPFGHFCSLGNITFPADVAAPSISQAKLAIMERIIRYHFAILRMIHIRKLACGT